jgi:putative transcriptional regulator
MKHFGKQLRRLRGERSQKEVANELGMPQTTLSTLENQDSVPRGDMLEKLAQYFAVPVTYFYPSQPAKPTASTKNWLRTLQKSSEGRDTVVLHGPPDVDERTKDQISQKIREKLEEAQNK